MEHSSLSLSGILVILTSFLLALILSILPFSSWILIIQPQWVALVVIYWVINLPQRVSLGIAWILGILLDTLCGTLLGEHALAMSVVAFLAQRLHQQIRMFPLLQQAFSIFLLIIIYQALLLWVQGILGELSSVRWFWVSAVTSMLFWPWIVLLMRRWQRHYRLY